MENQEMDKRTPKPPRYIQTPEGNRLYKIMYEGHPLIIYLGRANTYLPSGRERIDALPIDNYHWRCLKQKAAEENIHEASEQDVADVEKAVMERKTFLKLAYYQREKIANEIYHSNKQAKRMAA